MDYDQRWQQIYGDQFNAGRDINIHVVQIIPQPTAFAGQLHERALGCQNSERFVFPGSPFLPRLSEGFLERVKNQMVTRQIPPQLAIAADLLMEGGTYHEFLTQPTQMNALYKQFGTTGNDLYYYVLGFTSSLALVSVAFFAELYGPKAAEVYMSQMPTYDEESRKMRVYVRDNHAQCHALLLEDTTCADIFGYISKHPFREQTYYCVGLESARVSFFALNVELLRMLGF